MAMMNLLKEALGLVAKPSANAAKNFQVHNMGIRPTHPVKVLTIVGPDSGTWAATVVVATAPDGRGWSPVVETYEISNTTPGVVETGSTPCDNWGAWITAFSGDADVLGANGFRGINVMVEA